MGDDPLRAASEARARAAVEPLQKAVLRVRACLDGIEAVALESAREDVMVAMLSAIGQPFERKTNKQSAEDALLEAMADLRAIVRPEAPVTETIPSPPPKPAREVTESDVARVQAVLQDFAEIQKTYKQEHHNRLGLLLQITVADMRHMMEQLPVVHELHHQLSEAVRQAGHIKEEVPAIGFIHGLAHHHRKNWAGLANGLRQKLARFDRDASTNTAPRKEAAPPPSKRAPRADRSPMFDWPSLPKLRAAIQRAPAVIVGGSGKDAVKLSMVQQRLGLQMEWEPVESDNPRVAQSLADRIRAGSVSALVIVNGFMAHKVWWLIEEACKAASVPYAMAGKGGIGGIEAAARELDEKL